MKVKIKSKVYDTDREPIMLILEDEEIELINGMEDGQRKVCLYPNKRKWTEEKIKDFMKIDEAAKKSSPVIVE